MNVLRSGARATAVALGLLPALALAQASTADPYSQMLAYLTHSRLEGQVLAGASGSIKLNQAAGDLNRQYNGHALATGRQAGVQLAITQHGNDPLATDTPLHARAELAGQVLAGASGLASLNQASGQANDQANAVAVAVSGSAGQVQPSALPVQTLPLPASPAQRPAAAGIRQALVAGDALRGYAGVLQLNQIAGSFNAVENRLGLQLQAGP